MKTKDFERVTRAIINDYFSALHRLPGTEIDAVTMMAALFATLRAQRLSYVTAGATEATDVRWYPALDTQESTPTPTHLRHPKWPLTS